MAFSWILGAGLILLIVGVLTVVLKREISTGQALIFVCGGALVAIPQVSNFEFGDGTFKFTTRTQGAELTAQVTELNQEQTDLAKTVLELTEQNQALAETVAQIRNEIVRVSSNDSSSPSNFNVPEFVAPDLSDFKSNTQSLIEQSGDRLQQLDSLKQQFEPK